MKKGIALLITIGFLTILTALIGYMFSISQKSFDEVNKTETINQSSIIFADVKAILDSYVKKVKDSEDLDIFLAGIPPFYDQKSKLTLHVGIESLSNKININSLLVKKKVNKHIENFIKNICETYNILDPSFLVALILDTIDDDETSRQALSEISIENIKFSNSRVVDMNHFEKIVDYYAQTTQDTNIKRVPWGKLIYFGDKQKTNIDCDRLSKELVNVLRLQVEDFFGCDSLENEESKKIAIDYSLKPYNKNISYFVQVTILYEIDSIEDNISFDYDIKTNEVSNVTL